MAEKKKGKMSQNEWQEMLDNLSTGESGPFWFIKEGKTRVRLIPEEGSERFYAETTRVFRGKERVRFVVLGVVMGVSTRELADEWKNRVTPVIMTKTCVKGILALLAEGYDLLSPDGHGVTIVRSGKGLDTSYTVLPSPKPIPIPDDVVEAESSLEEYSQLFYQNSLERDSNRGDSGSEEAKPNPTKGSQSSGGEDW